MNQAGLGEIAVVANIPIDIRVKVSAFRVVVEDTGRKLADEFRFAVVKSLKDRV